MTSHKLGFYWNSVVFVLLGFFAANVCAQDTPIKDKISSAAQATVRKLGELREAAKQGYNKVEEATKAKYAELNRWADERGGWTKLSGQALHDANVKLFAITSEAMIRTQEVTESILRRAEDAAHEVGPSALLAVGGSVQKAEDMSARFARVGWSGKWIGDWEDATISTKQTFTLTITKDGDAVSGVMRDLDGALATISGTIKWVPGPDQLPLNKDYRGKFFEIKLLKRYSTSGVEVQYKAQLVQDRENFRYPNSIEGTWCRIGNADAGVVPPMGIWRMWPVQ